MALVIDSLALVTGPNDWKPIRWVARVNESMASAIDGVTLVIDSVAGVIESVRSEKRRSAEKRPAEKRPEVSAPRPALRARPGVGVFAVCTPFRRSCCAVTG